LTPPGRSDTRRRVAGSLAALATAAGVLTACGSSDGTTTLVWYINPDSGGQAAIAKTCSTDEYTITTQTLPQDANQQRVQLARRLEAHDSGIDLMSIDPPYTAELANGGLLAPIPQAEQDKLKQQSFKGATDAATWNGQLVVYPFWSNTQVLWYRKSFVEKAGLDMSQPVTWDQIIKAAADNGGTVAVQANKYEGYVVWINALVSGAGGTLITDASKGVDADVTINSPAGEDAARVIEELASRRPHHRTCRSPRRVRRARPSARRRARSWSTGPTSGTTTTPPARRAKDIGYAKYPETVEGKPPAAVRRYRDRRQHLLQAHRRGQPGRRVPGRAEAAGAPTPRSPATCRRARRATRTRRSRSCSRRPDQAVRGQRERRGARTVTPYWSDISGAIQSTWHPPASVTSSTPATSATFIHDVLTGKKLL
jgi:multiple sugar transport system substrate-binding protein